MEHKCLTSEEVKKARESKDQEKLREISEKSQKCVYCKRIFLKVFGS